MTKRVVLIGHPVAHSLSGAMQQAAFDALGIDARITAICDAPSGVFVSPVGAVILTPGVGTTTVEVRTTVDKLPSLAFRWIAFAQEGTALSRLPQAPEYGYWTTHEKGVF